MKRNQFTESKVPRTKGWHSQIEFDNMIADLDVSSLRFLKVNYDKKLRDFSNENDLNDEDNLQKYQQMKQRKKMVTEELYNRNIFESSKVNTSYFDPETGLVIDEEKGPIYSIAFNESETDYVIDANLTDEEIDQDDYEITTITVGRSKVVGQKINIEDKELSEIYKGWEYQDELPEGQD